MSHRLRTIGIALLSLTVIAAGLTGCRTARIGARCATTDFGQTATQILQCKRGRWRVIMTKAQYVQLLIALKNNATTTTAPPTTAPPTTAPPATTTTLAPPAASSYGIAGGYEHSCAVVSGAVRCVGHNQYGQLGNGTTTNSVTWVNTGITGGVWVSAASTTSCAVKSDGTAWCWGNGAGGLLGNGAGANSLVPVQVSGVTDATQISISPNGGCVRTSSGLAKCWGDAAFRGDGVSSVALAPVTASITEVVKVAAGTHSACALKSDGTVWCWGSNEDGQLGNGTTAQSLVPVQVSGIENAVDVASGGFGSSSFGGAACAVLQNGTVKCWGDDSRLQMGDGDASPAVHLTATSVVGLTDASKISLGFYTACAVRTTGAVKCWGLGGRLGDGTITPSSTPVDVVGVTNAVRISSVGTTTCALLSTNGAKCWGDNDFGEAGAGNTDASTSPLTVVGMP